MLFADIIKRHLVPLTPLPTQIAAAGKTVAPVKAFLFDIYGTLLISASGDLGIHSSTLDAPLQISRLLERFHIDLPPQNLKDKLIAAITCRHRRMKADGIDYPEIDIESIWRSVLNWSDMEKIKAFALEYELVVNPIWPMPHLQKLLTELAAVDIPMGIISNAQFYTPLILETLANGPLEGIGFDPDLVFFSYRYRRAKPSMFLFEKAAQHLAAKKIDPANVIYLGNDMRNDILPARKVGFTTALFAGDARSLRLRKDDPACRAHAADMIVTDLAQLLELPMA